jgi:CBS domain containing-hemolysin-like protein
VDKIVKAEATKLLDEAIVNDKKVSGWFWELLQRIEATINSVEVLTLRFAINIRDQGRRNTFEIGGAEFLEAPPWLAPSGKFFEN